VWGNIKGGSLRRGRAIDFLLTIEEVWDLFQRQQGRCAISGVEISFAPRCDRYRDATRTASLDRIDSKLSYTLDNVQWVHKDVNLMKMSLPEDVFINWCKSVADHSRVNGNVVF
jgi:hypothetical protein